MADNIQRQIETLASAVQDLRIAVTRAGYTPNRAAAQAERNAEEIDSVQRHAVEVGVGLRAQVNQVRAEQNAKTDAERHLRERVAALELAGAARDGEQRGRSEVTGRQDMASLRRELAEDRADERSAWARSNKGVIAIAAALVTVGIGGLLEIVRRLIGED